MKNNIPFKTIVWAIVVLVAMFLFRGTLEQLLSKTEKLSVLGVDVEIGSGSTDSLEKVAMQFEQELSTLNAQIVVQHTRMAKIDSLNHALQAEIDDCNGASDISDKINEQIDQANKTNDSLQSKTFNLKQYEIIRRPSIISNPDMFKPKQD